MGSFWGHSRGHFGISLKSLWSHFWIITKNIQVILKNFPYIHIKFIIIFSDFLQQHPIIFLTKNIILSLLSIYFLVPELVRRISAGNPPIEEHILDFFDRDNEDNDFPIVITTNEKMKAFAIVLWPKCVLQEFAKGVFDKYVLYLYDVPLQSV